MPTWISVLPAVVQGDLGCRKHSSKQFFYFDAYLNVASSGTRRAGLPKTFIMRPCLPVDSTRKRDRNIFKKPRCSYIQIGTHQFLSSSGDSTNIGICRLQRSNCTLTIHLWVMKHKPCVWCLNRGDASTVPIWVWLVRGNQSTCQGSDTCLTWTWQWNRLCG